MRGMTERKFDKDPAGVNCIACTTLHAMRGSRRRTYQDERADPADPGVMSLLCFTPIGRRDHFARAETPPSE